MHHGFRPGADSSRTSGVNRKAARAGWIRDDARHMLGTRDGKGWEVRALKFVLLILFPTQV